MTYRIITHGNCTDGFCSAFVFKKYYKYLSNLKKDDVENAEIIPLYPREVQLNEFEFTDKDILLDLPKPKHPVFFWADHHSSNKQDSLPENHFWKIAPSNTGFLLELAEKNGLKMTKELQDFKKAIDKIDSADYKKEDILSCYYPQKEYTSALQKLHQIGSMFHTRDNVLDFVIFTTLLKEDLGETPLSTTWTLSPEIFHRAQLINYQDWRDHVDEYLELIRKVVVQDDRKITFSRGVPDRFYSYIKYPDAAYNLVIKQIDEDHLRFGIGSNIFHKDRCKVDIGKLCKEVGKKFGEGSGGGHYYVGGGTILLKNGDKAKEFILGELK